MRSIHLARRLTLVAFVALAGVGGAGPAPATAEPDEAQIAVEFEDGAQAPAHGWTQEDGCPARTGASAARPLRGPLERAWKAVATDGTIEGEPLAWKDRVFVVERTAKRRVLRVFAAATGAERGRFSVESSAPLFPSVGEGRVLLKTSPTAVEALTVGESSLARRWKIVAKEGIGAPTLLRNEVYVVRDGVLERWAYGAAAPTWPKSPDASDAIRVARDVAAPGAESAPPRYPRPSLRGGSVFVTSGHDLVEVDRATGAERGRVTFEEDVDPESSRVVIASGDVFVRRSARAPAAELPALRFARISPGSIETRACPSFPVGLATSGPAWVGVLEEDGKRRLAVGSTGVGDGSPPYVLAGEGLHDEFVTATPPTLLPGAVYLGLRAFAFPSMTVLRSSPPTVASRGVPLRDLILVAESATVLSAWREPRRGDDRPIVGSSKAATATVTFKGCRAALDDGRILEGPFSYDPKTNVFRSTKSGEPASSPARTVEAVLTSEPPRRVVFASRPANAAAGVSAIVRSEAAKSILALVAAAGAAGDFDLGRRALATAVELGALDLDVAKAEASLGTLEAAAPAPPAKDEAKSAEVEASLAGLTRREADVLVEVAEASRKEAPLEVSVALVRGALQRDPAHAGAARWVRGRLPKELHVGEPFRIDDWLDFIEVRGRVKVRVWGWDRKAEKAWGSDGEVPSTSSDVWNEFWVTRSRWPAEGVEVVALECGPLLVFSPLERPGAIVRCLALGRLVADTLDATFAPMGPPRSDAETMVLRMFSSQKEYLEESRPGGEADRADGLENTAGHYSPSENITRIFFPDSDGGDAGSVPGVYAHELTHHWIERRRPGPDHERGDRSGSTPGYWVVEGFADFIRGFTFDVEGRRAEAENPRADYADCLTGIAADALIPWPTHLTLTQDDFQKLSVDDVRAVPRRFRLGPPGATVPKALFYDQGAAVCAYLYLAEGQKHRKALLDFVYAYYSGAAKADTLSKSTGLTLEELGKRVVAWCKDLTKK